MRKLEVLRAKGIPLTAAEARYREKVEELSVAVMAPYEKIQSLESSQVLNFIILCSTCKIKSCIGDIRT